MPSQEIIVEHTMPFFFARLFESKPAVDAGIVDEDVELPEHLYCPLQSAVLVASRWT
jgi:hypothetical protein